MSISAATHARDAGGRFLPGQSGNPAGKRPGTRNRATLLRELIEDGEEREIGRVLIDKAKAGDAVAARFVIAHLMPQPRGRAITLDLPQGARASDIVAAFNATLLAMAAGEITPEEALIVTRMFDGRLKALKACEIERNLTRWEAIPGDALFEPEGDEDEEYEGEEYEDEEDDAAAEASRAPSPAPVDNRPGGQDEGASPANALHLSKGAAEGGESACATGDGAAPAIDLHPGGIAADAAALHSACIIPSPATIAGRRRVAEAALRQWTRALPG